MYDRDLRPYDGAIGLRTFGQENAADFAADGKTRSHFANLDGVILQLAADLACAGEPRRGHHPRIMPAAD